jgi:hypothetical protein
MPLDGHRLKADGTTRTDMVSGQLRSEENTAENHGPLRLLRAFVRALPNDRELRELMDRIESDLHGTTDAGKAEAQALQASARDCLSSGDCAAFLDEHKERPRATKHLIERYCRAGHASQCEALRAAVQEESNRPATTQPMPSN